MNYELYRRSTLGLVLTDSLDELIQSQQLTPPLAMKVLSQFDKTMAETLSNRVRARVTFKGHLHTYRLCDDVWTFIVENCVFRLDDDNIHCQRLKIVACSAKKIEKP